MTIIAKLKVMNNVTNSFNEIEISSNCSNFVTIIHPDKNIPPIELLANDLREFLDRTLPLLPLVPVNSP